MARRPCNMLINIIIISSLPFEKLCGFKMTLQGNSEVSLAPSLFREIFNFRCDRDRFSDRLRERGQGMLDLMTQGTRSYLHLRLSSIKRNNWNMNINSFYFAWCVCYCAAEATDRTWRVYHDYRCLSMIWLCILFFEL